MDLYAAVVSTAPFLLLALLAEVKLFGPVAGSTGRRQRRQHYRTDQQVVGYVGVGFFVALLALATGWDHYTLRFVSAVSLGLAAFGLGAGVLRAIRASYDTPST